MYFNVVFNIPEGKGRLPSRLFFSALYRMGIYVDKYIVPVQWDLTPEDTMLYTDAILYDLLCYVKGGGEKNMDYQYCVDIVNILKSWASKNYTIKVT